MFLKHGIDVNFGLGHATCLHLKPSTHGHDNLFPFKIDKFRLPSRQADNQLAGKSLSHMQTLGYRGK